MKQQLRRVLGIATLTVAALTGCDPVAAPESLRFVAYGTDAVQEGNGLSAVANDDNPFVAGQMFLTRVSSFAWTSLPEFCDPFIEIGQNNRTFCPIKYTTGTTKFLDYLEVRALDGGGFNTRMLPTFGNGEQPDAVWGWSWKVAAQPAFYPWICTSPAECPSHTFPMALPNFSFQMTGAGNLLPTRLQFVKIIGRTQNGGGTVTSVGPILTIRPAADLLTVPIHAHLLTTEQRAAVRQNWADSFIPALDDRGPLRTNHTGTFDAQGNAIKDETFATLARAVGEEADRASTERGFFECKTQLRLWSVQFHPIPNGVALPNGEIEVTLPQGGNDGDCDTVLSTPLGSEIKARFNALPANAPQGIHIFVVDAVRNSNGSLIAGGFGCKMKLGANNVPTRPPFALVPSSTRSLDVHEIAHVLGLEHDGNSTAIRNMAKGKTLDAGQCATVRARATDIRNLTDG